MKQRANSRKNVSRRQAMQWSLHSLAFAAIAGAANVSLGADATTGPTDGISMTSFDQIEPVKFPWGWIRWLMNAKIDPKAEMTLGIVEIQPNSGNPLHIHPNSAEFVHVLSGSCKQRVGMKWIDLKAGDTVRIPKGTIHRATTGDEACRCLIVYDTGNRVMAPVEEDGKAKPQ